MVPFDNGLQSLNCLHNPLAPPLFVIQKFFLNTLTQVPNLHPQEDRSVRLGSPLVEVKFGPNLDLFCNHCNDSDKHNAGTLFPKDEKKLIVLSNLKLHCNKDKPVDPQSTDQTN